MPKTPKPKDKPNADTAFTITHYTDKNDRDFIQEWLDEMGDKKAKAAIASRIDRIKNGNFGDCEFLRDSVWELRIHVGPGYRVYYAKDGLTVILLLYGGDKRKQSRDIDRACDFWHDWQEQKKNQKKENKNDGETT